MAKRVSVDGWLFTVTLLLVFVGLVMVFSASAVMAKDRYGSGYYFVLRQMVWAVGGIVAMVVAMKVDYRRYKNPAVVFSALGITAFLLIAVFFLDRAHNTHRWIHWDGLSFQPSELAKPVLILFLSFFLESRTRSMNDWRNTLLPAVIPTLIFLGLDVYKRQPPGQKKRVAIRGRAARSCGRRKRFRSSGATKISGATSPLTNKGAKDNSSFGAVPGAV